ncbi:hypothetical protein OIDMADRAFT_164438 [Oidiodendron maius Zn]|uniref:Zn(2)-C6 fungal-type domain-containing protein n=1 Tax=Oidiodendron maius (strain Zn) TaxID=913774 RepID=A0A0C3HD10_OIDMZ|nr:hypothetical protein OIDMADRAFT_164438 [Oidiodendron maius Zn]
MLNAPGMMEPLNETAWFQSDDQTQPTDSASANNVLFQMDALGYDFSFPNLDSSCDLYPQPAPFPNLQCFGVNGSARTKSRVSLACIPCRNRHTRCDAITPICSQCCSVSDQEDSTNLLDLYYASFHDSHPIILPRKFFEQRLQTNRHSLVQLLLVMEFIGSLFASKASKEDSRLQVENMLQSDDLPESGFTVQALQLYAIAIHSCDEFEHARAILDRAIQMAVQIGMRSSSFAIVNGEGSAVLEESWRRTWWMLFIVDGSFAAIRHCSAFSMNEILSDVHLPCEEAEYQSGIIPQPRTLEEYSAREFAGEEVVFSSFTYLIALGQILGGLLALGTALGEPLEPDAVAADASLMNWLLYLPKEKRLPVEEPGKVDKILFQAHMLYNTEMVYLHRPRSLLTYGSVEQTSKCAPPPSEKSVEEQQRAYDFHTTKVLQASESAIGLFTLPTTFLKHTPLVICSMTLLLLAQIAACRLKLKGLVYNAARDRIRLGLGVIKTMGEVWPVAQKTVKEVQIIARETLSLPKTAILTNTDDNNGPCAEMT